MAPVIVGALGMIKKGQINILIKYLAVPASMKYKKNTWRNCSSPKETKNNTQKEAVKKIY